jgi:hypothetical protein
MVDQAGAALSHASQAATFGLAARGAAAIQYGAANIPGLNTVLGNKPITWDQANANIQNGLEQQYAEHPIASNLGSVGGMVLGGAGMAKGLTAVAEAGVPVVSKAVGAITAPAAVADASLPLSARMGTMAGNVGRAAGLGAVTSAVANEAQNPNLNASEVGLAAAEGAIGGPIIGKAVGVVGQAMAPLFAALAQRMGTTLDTPAEVAAVKAVWPVFKDMTPAQRSALLGSRSAATGTRQALVTGTTPTEGAAVADLATKYPQIGVGLQDAQAAALREQPQALAAKVAATGTTPAKPPSPFKPTPAPKAATPPAVQLANTPGTAGAAVQDTNALTTARNVKMDKARAAVAGTPNDWSVAKVPLTDEDLSILTRKSVRAALAGADEDGALLKRYNDTIEDLTDENGNPVAGAISDRLTVDDMDNIRQTVGGYANAAENSHRAGSINDTRDMVADLAKRASPTYDAALAQFRSDSDYVRGFKLANAGKEVKDVEAGHPSLRGSGTADFAAGQAAGAKSRLAGQAGESEAGAVATAQALSEKAGTQARTAATMGQRAADTLGVAGKATKDANAAMALATPSAVTHTAELDIGGKVGAGVLASAVGMTKTGMAQLMGAAKALIGQGGLSAAEQKLALDMLLTKDPLKQRQVLARLTQAGLDEQKLKTLQSIMGAMVAAPMQSQTIEGRR